MMAMKKDVKLAERIVGKDVKIIKGKSKRTKPPQVVDHSTRIPKKLVAFSMDIMYMNDVIVLTTIDKK